MGHGQNTARSLQRKEEAKCYARTTPFSPTYDSVGVFSSAYHSWSHSCLTHVYQVASVSARILLYFILLCINSFLHVGGVLS